MPKVNIYVTDELREKMTEHSAVNWSEIAQVNFWKVIGDREKVMQATEAFNENKKKLEEVCDLPNGYTLYRKANGVGGHTYLSDEVGGGAFVWDTCLVDSSTLLAAILEETRAVVAEKRSYPRDKTDLEAMSNEEILDKLDKMNPEPDNA